MNTASRITIFIILCLLYFQTRIEAGDKLWVIPKGAGLKAEKSASSGTVAMLPGGAELKVVSKEKKWYRVAASSGETGWIYRGKISKKPPVDTDGDDELLDGLADSGIELSAADTSRSIRGKPKPGMSSRNGADAVHLEALDLVLSFYASDEEIDKFLKAGRIGEYAE